MGRVKNWKRTASASVQPKVARESVGVRLPEHSDATPVVGRILTLADQWVDRRSEWIVWILVGLALALRVARARSLYLNGDEAMIMFAPLQHSMDGVYRAMLVHPHGPLPNFLLHYLTFFGSSELYLRLPSVIAGTLVPLIAYRWISEAFGKAQGFVTACILGFSPAMVNLSAQLRFYMIQILFMVISLYCLERALRRQSVEWMRLFGLAALIAFLSEYMSIWYIAAIGIYSLIRLIAKHAPRRLMFEWVLTQVVTGIIIFLTYVVHLRKLQGTAGEFSAKETWLRNSYYQPSSESLTAFIHHSTDQLFGYVFANSFLGTWMLILFLIGIALTLWGHAGAPQNRRLVVLSFLLPLVITVLAAALRFYPYGGTRHDAFLAVFIAPPIAVGLGFLARNRLAILMLLLAYLVPTWLQAAEQHVLDDVPEVSRREQMKMAIDYLTSRGPKPRVIVVDQLGSATLGYYLCHGQTEDSRSITPAITSYRCAAYRVLTLEAWGAPFPTYLQALRQVRTAFPDLLPDPAWAFVVSFERRSGETSVSDSQGIFGKLEVRRLSP